MRFEKYAKNMAELMNWQSLPQSIMRFPKDTMKKVTSLEERLSQKNMKTGNLHQVELMISEPRVFEIDSNPCEILSEDYSQKSSKCF